MSSPSFTLLWRSSLMYSHALDKMPPLLWGEGSVGKRVRLRGWPLDKAWTHLSRLGVIDVAVRDGLGQLHDPVVDLISAPALDCRDRDPNIQRLFSHRTAPPSGRRADLRCAALAASRLWNRAELPASWTTRRRSVKGSLSTRSSLPERDNYAM